MRNEISEILPKIIELRHTLHRHPELRYEEFKTAQLITDTLISWGYKPETGIAKTGVVAILDSGNPGKTIALRADMDALPIIEAAKVDYLSENPGRMHACGHDGHMATLLLAAYLLKDRQKDFSGKIKFIFQPAEEGGHGAGVMIKENVLKNVDAIFGYHNIPTLPKNTICVRESCILAGCILFGIEIRGKGGHSSAPEKSIDSIYIGSTIIQALQSIVSRSVSPFDPIVISVTQFHAGSADNVIPDKAILRGTIRITDNKKIEFIKNKMQEITQGIAKSLGGTAIVEFPQTTPATINSKNETQLVKNLAEKLFGSDHVMSLENNLMATEDFSFYLEKIPGCFFLVGTGVDKQYVHHPEFVFEDEILPVAGELMAQIALAYLNNN